MKIISLKTEKNINFLKNTTNDFIFKQIYLNKIYLKSIKYCKLL